MVIDDLKKGLIGFVDEASKRFCPNNSSILEIFNDSTHPKHELLITSLKKMQCIEKEILSLLSK